MYRRLAQRADESPVASRAVYHRQVKKSKGNRMGVTDRCTTSDCWDPQCSEPGRRRSRTAPVQIGRDAVVAAMRSPDWLGTSTPPVGYTNHPLASCPADGVAPLEADARADRTARAAFGAALADSAGVGTWGCTTPGRGVETPAACGYPSRCQGAPAIVRRGRPQRAVRPAPGRLRRSWTPAVLGLTGPMARMSIRVLPTAGRRRATGGR